MKKNTEIKGEVENNGWIKIDDDNDYPHKYGHYFFRWECAQGKEHIEIYNVNNRGINCPPSATITHYQPIIKPEPPKF